MRGSAALLAAFAGLAVASAAHANSYKAPRTPWGAPNLEGEWTNISATHLERPPGLSTLIVSDEAAAAFDQRTAATARTSPPGDVLGQAESEWRDVGRLARIDGRARSSWLTSPATGKLPWRPEGQAAFRKAGSLDHPETLTPSDRCLAAGWSAVGPPMLNSAYASNYQILQRPDEVVIVAEVLHEVRTIRIDGKPLPAGQRQWMGDSVGHWEGDTLVVRTTGFHRQEGVRAPVYLISPDAQVTERFTRVSPKEIRYAFWVDDPATYTAVWSGEEPFLATNVPIYEYACAEGNYAVAGMLAGARREDALTRAQPKPDVDQLARPSQAAKKGSGCAPAVSCEPA